MKKLFVLLLTTLLVFVTAISGIACDFFDGNANWTAETTAPIVSDAAISGTAETAAIDTGKIVFSSNRDSNNEIYIMNADGTSQTRLTDNSATDANPKISADGRKIVFNSNRDGNQEIYVMNADGTDQTRITNNTFIDIEPAWSPDGSKIAFSSTRSGTPQIWIMNTDGSYPVQLTFDPYPDIPMNSVRCYAPDWSYDGTRITFSTIVFTDIESICIMNADGSNLVTIATQGMIAQVSEPAWSPDNMHIAISLTPIGGQGYNGRIMTVDSNGSNGVFLSSSDFDFAPAYSPDGSKIAFYSRRDGNNEIYIMNIDGSNETRLSNNAADDSFPSWGPNNAKVATPPIVATADAIAIAIGLATLNGNLTSLGKATQVNVSFEYGTTTSYGSTAIGVPPTLTSAGAFTANLTGLTPGQTYHFMAKADGDGTVYGNDASFTTATNTVTSPDVTPPDITPPGVTTNSASGITTNSATLNGNLSGLGTASSVTVSFEYGTTTSYGSAAAGVPPTRTNAGAFTANLTGLTPGQTYHFRAKAVVDGTIYGNDATFTTTTGPPPVVITNEASDITATSATLNGNLSNLGFSSTVSVSFEWGTTTAYGNTSADQTFTTKRNFTAALTNLTTETKYHFRAKAVGDGTTYGNDTTFTATTPASFTLTNLNITPSTSQLGDTVNIAVTCTNSGGITGSYSVILKINGVSEQTEEVSLDPDKSRFVTFAITESKFGTYDVNVNELTSSFVVQESNTPVSETKSEKSAWPLIAGIGGGVIVVGLIVLYVFRRRIGIGWI